MYQPVLVPKIAAALLSPNPADINQKVKIIVTVEEETILLRPSFFLAVMLLRRRVRATYDGSRAILLLLRRYIRRGGINGN